MNIDILAAELTNDPLTRGYSGMTDDAAAADLNTVYRSRNRDRMSSTEVFQSMDIAEFNALTDRQKDNIMGILAFGEVNPFGQEASIFVDHFGGGSDTITALAAARKEDISRAEELGFRFIKPGHVNEARN